MYTGVHHLDAFPALVDFQRCVLIKRGFEGIVLLYLCLTVIPLLEVLLSSSNIITTNYSLFKLADEQETIPSNPRLFRTQRWKSTNAGNNQGDVHRCTSLFHMFHVTWPVEPCNMRICCTARDWFSTNQTSQFVQRYNKIGSRPIKIHSLFLRYNKQFCITSHDQLVLDQ